MSDKSKDDSLTNTYREVGPYLGLGLQLAATIVIMVLIGDWIDKKYGTSPLWTIITGFLGITTGMYQLIKTVLHLQKRSEKKDNPEN